MMYSALVEPAMEGGEPCIRILLIAYAVYGLSRYCIRNTSDLAHPLLDFPSDYLGEFSQLYLAGWTISGGTVNVSSCPSP